MSFCPFEKCVVVSLGLAGVTRKLASLGLGTEKYNASGFTFPERLLSHPKAVFTRTDSCLESLDSPVSSEQTNQDQKTANMTLTVVLCGPFQDDNPIHHRGVSRLQSVLPTIKDRAIIPILPPSKRAADRNESHHKAITSSVERA